MFQALTSKITRKRLKSFLEAHQTSRLTLEVGAKTRPYKDIFPNTISFDINLHTGLNLQADAHDLPFKSGSFSSLLATEVLEHTHDPHQVINEFHRVLRKRGKLILTTRFIFPLHDTPHDYFRFTKYGLKHLCRDFSKVTITPETTTIESLAVLFQRFASQTVIGFNRPVVNLFLHLIAKSIIKLPKNLIKKEFGDITHTTKETTISTSGYYLVAIK